MCLVGPGQKFPNSEKTGAMRNQWLLRMSVSWRSNGRFRSWGASTDEQTDVEMSTRWNVFIVPTESMHQGLTEWVTEWMNERKHVRTNERKTNEWMGQLMAKRRKDWMTEWLTESKNARIAIPEQNTEWVSQWLNEPTDQWSVAEAMNKWRSPKMGVTPKSPVFNRIFHYKQSVLVLG